MGIIIKYAIDSIRDRKARAILIIIAIMLSSTLLFVSLSLSDTLIDLYKERMRQFSGTAELMITSKNKNDLIDKQVLENIHDDYKDKYDYTIGVLNYTSNYKQANKEISLLGIKMDDLKKFNPITLEEGNIDGQLQDDEIIISSRTAKRYNINLKDEIKLYINNTEKIYKVVGIAQNKGIFLDESEVIYSIVSFDGMNKYLGQDEKCNIIFLKTSINSDVIKLQREMQQSYDSLKIEEPFTIEEIDEQVNRIATPLLLVTIVIALISVYIIYSSFKVITMEKISTIGIFRSVGASKYKANLIFIIESLFYGFIGGILACILGIGILYLVSYLSIPIDLRSSVDINLNFNYIGLVITMIVSLILSLISCLIPIIRVSSMSIKSIIFNEVKAKKKTKYKMTFLGIIFIIGALIFPRNASSDMLLISSMISIILAITGIAFLVEPILKLIARICIYIFINSKKGTVNIALNNVLNNESIVNSIRLLTIGIATLLMINTVSTSVGKEVLNFYENIAIYDLEYKTTNLDQDRVEEIKKMNQVDSIMPVYQGINIEVSGMNDTISLVESVDSERFDEYWNIVFYDDMNELFSKLERGNNIILTTILRDRYNLKNGDEIKLQFEDKEKVFKVIGFVYTLNENGSYALISNENAKEFFNLRFYSDAYINLKSDYNIHEFENYLQGIHSDEEQTINLKTDVTKQKMDSNSQLFSILSSVSILALIIGTIGISNNQIISYIQRKKNLAILRSIGMNKKQIIKMIFIESIISGVIGGIIGDIAGYIMISIVPFVMKGIKLPIPIHINYKLFVIYLIGALIIIMISAIIPMIKSSKSTIIEEIKYE